MHCTLEPPPQNTVSVINRWPLVCGHHINLYLLYSLHILLHAAVGWLPYFLQDSGCLLFWFIIKQIYCLCHSMSLVHLSSIYVYSYPRSCELCAVTPEGICCSPYLIIIISTRLPVDFNPAD